MEDTILVSEYSLIQWYAKLTYGTEHVTFIHKEILKEVRFQDGSGVRIHYCTPIYSIEINGTKHLTTGSLFNSSKYVARRIQECGSYYTYN